MSNNKHQFIHICKTQKTTIFTAVVKVFKMTFTEQQIETLAPNPGAFNSGKSLSNAGNWITYAQNERVIWGTIKGSGKNPYLTQIDINTLAYKCNCPSRQFPCKHGIGLMLLYARNSSAFLVTHEEPEWVKAWMDKRVGKPDKDENPVERTAGEQEKLDKARDKNRADRIDAAMAGVAELELWLKDLIRIGILDLPSKPLSDFEKVAARMVDAKVPGFAGWVKSLAKLNFDNQDQWQTEALSIISKLYLLLRTFRNYENLTPVWQQTIKNLAGWSQSTKELLADSSAETVRDLWLVAGQETETNDDITTQRNWLIGTQSNRKALILNFATRFSSIETPLLPGSILEAELAFFPSALPHRAAIKMQRSINYELKTTPEIFKTLNDVFAHTARQLNLNPWASDFLIFLQNTRLYQENNKWLLYDAHNYFIPLCRNFDMQKIMHWLLFSGNKPCDVAFILRNGNALPLGIIQNNQYKLL